ncbi:lytic transglycosylase domain-containing protein [Hippea jasoniae]|uniref:lytic transglycosylase domain-containing protein n=1 Tax=Hippea jasoniae TaxID=944479 RepID=UPI0009FCB52E|nr:lytic transglycosylase domain-containing protein [Hippea jasoniae]
MRFICGIVVAIVFVSVAAEGFSIKQVLKNGEVVYTNMPEGIGGLFFRRAYKYSHISKARIQKLIETIARRYGVNPELVDAIARVESNYDINAVSDANAKGVMQLMKQTARYYGVEDPFDAKQNIEGGVRFLKHLIDKYHDIRLVAAAYNAGETAVDRYGGIPPFKETRRYVVKVLRVLGHSNKKLALKNITYKARPVIEKNGVFTNIGGLW